MRGGELIAEYLIGEQVPYVFGLCGHGIIGLMDALAAALRSDRPTVVDVAVDVTPPIATGTWRLPPLAYPEPNYPSLLASRPPRR